MDPINRPVEDSIPPDEARPKERRLSAEQARQAYAEFSDLKRQQEIKDLRAVLATEAGMRVLLRVLGVGRLYDAKVQHDDAISLARAEGRRQASLWLVDEITNVDPDAYPKLLAYNVGEAKRRADFLAGIEMAKGRG